MTPYYKKILLELKRYTSSHGGAYRIVRKKRKMEFYMYSLGNLSYKSFFESSERQKLYGACLVIYIFTRGRFQIIKTRHMIIKDMEFYLMSRIPGIKLL